jgi:AraC family transcriptional regulator
MKPDSFLIKEYGTRINRVQDYIQANLGRELGLDELSRVACFSPFHFHRIYAAMTGETLGDFIRRKRLEKAAGLLLSGQSVSVTGICYDCGFSSPAVFARAFREYFGTSPSAWRETGSKGGKRKSNTDQTRSKQSKAESIRKRYNSLPKPKPRTGTKGVKMKVEVRQLPGYHVAYMRYTGPYGPGVSKHWEKFNKWARAHRYLGPQAPTPVALGISHDDPSITPPEKCRYDSCAVVPAEFEPGPSVNASDIPGGEYAVLRFKGTDRTIGDAWRNMYAVWLPQSGYQCDDRPCFEMYTREHQCHSDGSWECDICIPVKPL